MQLFTFLIMGTIFIGASLDAETPKHRRLLPGKAKENTRTAAPAKAEAGQGEKDADTGSSKATSEPMGKNRVKEAKGVSSGCAHPIETFIQIASASSPQAASDGVYFVSDMRESPQLYFQSRPGMWPQQISFFPDGVVYYKMSPDGEKILLATHEGGDEQYDIFLLEKKTILKPLLVDRTNRIESVAWSPDSKWFAYTANMRNKIDMDLYRFDLATMKSEKLLDLSGNNTVTDVSKNAIALTNFRSVTDSDVLLYQWESKSLKTLAHGKTETYNESGSFTADGKHLIFLSDRAKGISQVFVQAVTGEAPAKPLTAEPFPVDHFELSPRRTQLGYLKNENGYSIPTWLEIDERGSKKRAVSFPMPKKSVVRSLSFSKQGVFYTDTSSTDTSDIWHWNGQTRVKWTRSAELKTECFQGEELVSYPSFDGRMIPAFLYRPRTDTPARFIVFVHGGPEAQFRPIFNRIFQYFIQRGFGILALNIRGSMGFGREFTLLDNYKKRMDSVQDVVAGSKWLIEKRLAHPGKLAIYGGSYGGFLVLRAIEVAPELFHAASESVGISNFVTFLKNTKPYRRALREVEYGPLSDEEFLKSVSPIHYIDQIKTPLLIFHGANDPRVPVSETEQIVKELKDRNIEVEHKIFANEGHGNRKLGNQMEQARLMAHFFEKHIEKEKGP